MIGLNARQRLMVALDHNDRKMAIATAQMLAGNAGALKIGFELFVSTGPELVQEFVENGHRVFLDLKLHDIPNTVAKTAAKIAKMGVFMFNVHASGGAAMMRAAMDAVGSVGSVQGRRPLVVAVTLLTSLDQGDLDTLGLSGSPEDVAVRLAVTAKQCGLDGVVASAREAGKIKQACGENFLVVSPGIRPAGAEVGDQKRVMTPEKAIVAGSDFLVVGRPITDAPDPAIAAGNVILEIERALAND